MVDLEIKYSPSKWSKRLSGDVICQRHVEITSQRSESARNQIPCELDIIYGDGSERQRMDIFGTDLDDTSPVYIHIHGGYWQEPSITHTDQEFIATQLYKNKIKSIFVGYELCPEVTMFDINKSMEEVLIKCLQYAKEHSTGGIYLGGHSAGGHLIAYLFTKFIKTLSKEDQKLIKGAFLHCGIYDLTEIPLTSVNDPLNLDEVSAKKLSPFFYKIYDGAGTEFFVVAAEYDAPEFVKQSKEFHEKLLADGIKSKYIFVENVDHFDCIENLHEEDFKLTKIMVDVMKRK